MKNERPTLERQNLVRAWYRYVTRQEPVLAIPDEPDDQPARFGEAVDHKVAASWARSALTVSPERVSAPVVSEADVKHPGQESPLESSVRGLIPELRLLAVQADLIVGIGNTDGTLLWIEGSDRMANLALALHARQPVQGFSAEHYGQTVHAWVCDSSPIRDTQTGALLCVVALHPGGLTLDALHAHVYGDQPISLSTLKSEVSTLRSLLGRQIASRFDDPEVLEVLARLIPEDDHRLPIAPARAALDAAF
ncbi:hypothetical protein [Deinococcus sp.]|uniref:hypothetical protein n=1 Tax=Deinococcus sp. TaxID=47478 RepID=UPI002869CFF9|nr:hypothetical protein [Deinococcus sp.]